MQNFCKYKWLTFASTKGSLLGFYTLLHTGFSWVSLWIPLNGNEKSIIRNSKRLFLILLVFNNGGKSIIFKHWFCTFVFQLFLLPFCKNFQNTKSLFFQFKFKFWSSDSVEICKTGKSINEIVSHCLTLQHP